MNEIFISHHSTAIEGSTLTEEESHLLIEEGITAKGKLLYDHNMVKDNYEALKFVVETAKEKEENNTCIYTTNIRTRNAHHKRHYQCSNRKLRYIQR